MKLKFNPEYQELWQNVRSLKGKSVTETTFWPGRVWNLPLKCIICTAIPHSCYDEPHKANALFKFLCLPFSLVFVDWASLWSRLSGMTRIPFTPTTRPFNLGVSTLHLHHYLFSTPGCLNRAECSVILRAVSNKIFTAAYIIRLWTNRSIIFTWGRRAFNFEISDIFWVKSESQLADIVKTL
jgi:hypothetical protein